MMSRRYILAAAISAVFAVSAHAETIKISIDKLVFDESGVNAKVGDTIEWVNNDVLAHTATARNGDWDVAIPAKATASLTLKKAGTIDYYCRYHPNMKGRIVIAPK